MSTFTHLSLITTYLSESVRIVVISDITQLFVVYTIVFPAFFLSFYTIVFSGLFLFVYTFVLILDILCVEPYLIRPYVLSRKQHRRTFCRE